MTTRIRIGIDTGGTFTDVVALDEATGALVTTKTPSTPANPADGFMAGVGKVLELLGGDGRDVAVGQPRHHGRHQPAARGQGRRPRLHHHRGLRVPARDRPAVACPTATATPTSGSSRRGSCRLHRVRTVGGRLDYQGSEVRPFDEARRRRGGPLVPRRGHRHASASASCTPTPTPAHERRDARGAAPRAPGRGRLDLQRGAARVPRVRARGDHPGRRRRQAADGVATSRTSPARLRRPGQPGACRST